MQALAGETALLGALEEVVGLKDAWARQRRRAWRRLDIDNLDERLLSPELVQKLEEQLRRCALQNCSRSR